MSGTVVALPSSGDQSTWTPGEAALVEAAGLVSGPAQNRRIAPRPVVEAFLAHCRRTALDPIARQIYCIERGGKWTTQISIDGARLVAERSREYRGQTPTEWTADGVTWTEVWLAKEPPRAARVGVHREGFVAPVYAVATFDAYNAGSPIWKKMPALMLGKCAEMLALRKAFPQDLSGLYSAEEMAQASAPAENAQRPARAAQAPAVAAPASPSEPVDAERDWAAEIGAAGTVDALRAVYQDADRAGQVQLPIEGGTVIQVVTARKAVLLAEAEPEPLIDAPAAAVERDWLGIARGLSSVEDLRALLQKAKASGASEHELQGIGELAADLGRQESAAPEWAGAGEDAPQWVAPGEALNRAEEER